MRMVQHKKCQYKLIMIKNKIMSEEEQLITQEEAQSNHNLWWNSLTNEEKENFGHI